MKEVQTSINLSYLN